MIDMNKAIQVAKKIYNNRPMLYICFILTLLNFGLTIILLKDPLLTKLQISKEISLVIGNWLCIDYITE